MQKKTPIYAAKVSPAPCTVCGKPGDQIGIGAVSLPDKNGNILSTRCFECCPAGDQRMVLDDLESTICEQRKEIEKGVNHLRLLRNAQSILEKKAK